MHDIGHKAKTGAAALRFAVLGFALALGASLLCPAAASARDRFADDAFTGYKANVENGKYLFNAAGCGACHGSGENTELLSGGMEMQTAIGTFGYVGVAAGTVTISGNMTLYLKDGTAYNKYVNNTASSIAWRVKDGAGNAYVFTLPKIKFSSGKVVAGSINQDALVEMPFTALMDATTAKTIFIDRLAA